MFQAVFYFVIGRLPIEMILASFIHTGKILRVHSLLPHHHVIFQFSWRVSEHLRIVPVAYHCTGDHIPVPESQVSTLDNEVQALLALLEFSLRQFPPGDIANRLDRPYDIAIGVEER